MMERSDNRFGTFSVPSSEGVDSPRSGLRDLSQTEATRDVFVLRDIFKHENTFEGVLNSLLQKRLCNGSSRNTIGINRSCMNMMVAAEVLGWSQEMRYEMRNFLNDPDIKSLIEQWMLKIAWGEDRPVLEISRPLPNGIDMDMLEHFIGYYDTGRFTCNLCVLVTVSLLLEAKPKG